MIIMSLLPNAVRRDASTLVAPRVVVLERDAFSTSCTSYQVSTIYLKGCWNYHDHKISITKKITKKHGPKSCGSYTQRIFSTSCTILPSMINISQRMLKLRRSEGYANGRAGQADRYSVGK